MIDTSFIVTILPSLVKGAWLSIQIASISCLIGLTLGVLLGTLHSSKNRFVKLFILLYTTLFRGTPMLIQILFARYALPRMGIIMPAFWSAVCAIGLNSAAYISFIVHSGISSVPRGQIEAGKVLGFSYFQILRYIVLPQALQIVFPALGNEFITLVKDSSLASVIGVPELTQQSNFILSRSLDAISIYAGVALIYLVMTTTLSILMTTLERKMKLNAGH